MGKHQTSIEINGKRYDARTGIPLAGHTVAVPPKPVAKPVLDVIQHRSPAKTVHVSPERSKTLMRHAVKKPAKLTGNKLSHSKSMTDVASPMKPATAQPNSLHHQYDAAREKRALAVKRSSLVSKFSGIPHHQATPVGIHHDQPVPQRIESMPVHPTPAHAHPARRLPASHSVIDRGLKAAQSHTQEHTHTKQSRTKRRARFASVSAGVLAVVLIGAFFTYQNMPNIAMRYAAARSGVSASMPNYQPSGFALNHRIKYTPGQITMSFNSNADDREFTITQRESSWNSETLRSNYVAETTDNIQTFEDKGRTIYLYGDSNATWVNGGIWYDINGNSQLNSDQLIRIATSM